MHPLLPTSALEKAPFTGQGPSSICHECKIEVYARLREEGESLRE